MQSLIDVLVRHGYAVVFGWVPAEQIGLPLPAEPFLLASGGVAGTGRPSLPLILVAASIASLLADTMWYWIGRLPACGSSPGSAGLPSSRTRVCAKRSVPSVHAARAR